MKRSVLLLPVLVVLVLAWWVVRDTAGVQQQQENGTEPVAYPAALWEELGRLPGLEVVQADPSMVPVGLNWQDGHEEAEIGDPAARRGGSVQLANVGPYPAHFLAFGSPTPQFFHYSLFTMVEVPLVARHPASGRPIPGVAERWAVQGRTVYFSLRKEARYSNGRPVRAADYALGLLLRFQAGYSRDWTRLEQLAEKVTVYGDHGLAVTLRQPSPSPVLALAPLLHPAEPGFYAEFGSDYAQRYADRVPPTTGAYTVGKRQRGRFIELRRVPVWWAEELPFYRYTCNVQSIGHHFLVDEAQAWELFLRERLDVIQTRNTAAWQRYLESPQALARVQKHRFDADYPMPPYGIALNACTLSDPVLRRGVMQALDMDRVVDVLFQGEGERLATFSSGYGALTPNDTPAVKYDPAEARSCFAHAGYTKPGSDGILQRSDGVRLSLRLTYVPSDKLNILAGILAESARACGLELVPDPVPWQINAKKIEKLSYQLTFWASAASEPLPHAAAFFDAGQRGHDAPFGVDDEKLAHLIESCRRARSEAELADCVRRADRRIEELAIWLPGWKENQVHLAHWPRVRFPDTEACRFAYPRPYEVMEAHLYWVEETP